jgi:hypothetical protein
MPTYKDITIHSWYLTPQKGRCSCQRISHTIEIAGLHSKAKKKKLLFAIPAIQPVRNENLKLLVLDTVQIYLKNEGMDFTEKNSTPIYATGDGIVKR